MRADRLPLFSCRWEVLVLSRAARHWHSISRARVQARRENDALLGGRGSCSRNACGYASIISAFDSIIDCVMVLMSLIRRSFRLSPVSQAVRVFSSANVCAKEQPLPPRRVIPETDMEEKFLHGSGPGGQKINKTSSAVQIKHLPTGIVVKCQHTRSRPQNRKIARQLLAEKLDDIEKGDESRSAIKQARASKKKASATKKSRRKYKKLDEARRSGEEATTESVIEQPDRSVKPEPAFINETSTSQALDSTGKPS